ncbi:hypothetical protein [Paraburkholderia humisilvae]|uniref:EamA domain-containing protein n=1 Tax=Paraburkholderia humisilvae TaxID=627669 RepID=A0A6J5F314_9BURK|nr:hypothetical protein [Paraburkholderia humisilvae]CAB3772814.1 hypothetical protein LMG29542_06990 [Paraburkholderia humisilvae]
MNSAHALSFLAVLMQSTGKVMYGTFLEAVAPAQFLLISFCVVAGVFLIAARGRLPAGARGAIVAVNVWTAVAFVCFFYALKHLSPAAVGAIEIGVAVLVAVVVASWRSRGRPRAAKLCVCAGIVGGCALLVPVELERAAAVSWNTVFAIAASASAGAASTLMVGAFQQLAHRGWGPSAILAHRFYLTITVALVWVAMEGGVVVPAVDDALPVVAVAVIGVMLPLLLMQFAVRKTDGLTLMICMALQPVMSFALSMLSPVYAWQPVTLIGTLVVAGALGLDVWVERRGQVTAVAARTPQAAA